MQIVSVEKMEVVDARSIYQRIQQIAEDLLGVARDYVEALDRSPGVRMELEKLGVAKELLRRLERVGRGSIAPALVFCAGMAAQRVMSLPLSEQEEILRQGVEVLSLDGLDHRRIPLEELSPDQVRQVFSEEGVRSLSQQRTYLENEREAQRVVEPIQQVDVVYKIRGKRVIFTRPCEMTARQLAMILAEVES
jgi:hypothetical protein